MSSLPKSANVLVEGACVTRTTYQRVGASFLLVLLFASSLFSFFVPQKTSAQGLFVPVYDQAVVLELSALNGIAGGQLAATESLTIKETILDMILFGLINTIIDQLGNEVVKWIEGGFEGQPGFIQDPGGFMVGVGDQLSGQLIANLGLENFLCDPFQFPSLQLGLSLKFGVGYPSAHRKFYCTVLRAAEIQTKSVKGFLEGDFGAQGGWDMWADIAVNNQNVIGASTEASMEIDKRLASLLGMESNKLDWGSGFLSKTNINGYIETPGKVVENTLNDTFDSGRRRIEVADEISEIVGALISVAMKSVMTGLGGGGTGVSFTSNYSGGIPTFSATDYEAAKARGLPVKTPPAGNSNLPAIAGTIGGTQVYTSIANQGPSTHNNCSGSNCDATYAVDSRKAGSRPMAILNKSSNNWWEADLVSPVSLNRLTVYNPTGGDSNLVLRSPAQIKLLDQSRNDISASFGCEMRYLNPMGNPTINNSCVFPPGALAIKSYDITLTPTTLGPYPKVRYIRIEQNGINEYLAIDEVEFFKRNPPVFAATQSTSTGPGLFFDPYLNIAAASSDDEDGNGILDPIPQNGASVGLPLAGITYTTRAPDGIIRPFNIVSGYIATGTPLGAWTFTYTATDKYGLASSPLTRVVTLSQIITNAPPRTAPVILHNGSIVTGEVGAITIAKGSSFDVFDKITARDTDGTAYTPTSPAPLNVRASYSRNGVNENFWNSNSPGTWIITYSFVDRFGLPQSNNIYRTITVTP